MPRFPAGCLALLWLSLPGCAVTPTPESGPIDTPAVAPGLAGLCGGLPTPQISLTLGGKLLTPAEGQPVDVVVEGRVQDTGGGSLVIDTCDPTTGCKPTLALLEVSASELPDAPVPADALVHVHYFAALGGASVGVGGVAHHVVVQNLSAWGSLTSSVSTADRVWLIADTSDGALVDVPPGFDPLVITTEKSACDTFPVQHGLRVSASQGKGVFVDVGMRGVVDVTGPLEGHYTVRNLQYREDDAGKARGYWIVGS